MGIPNRLVDFGFLALIPRILVLGFITDSGNWLPESTEACIVWLTSQQEQKETIVMTSQSIDVDKWARWVRATLGQPTPPRPAARGMVAEVVSVPCTRQSRLYLIGSGLKGDPIKIGISGDVGKRLSQLQASNPHKLEILFSVDLTADIVYKVETACHNSLKRYHLSGEWFNVDLETSIKTVKSVIRRKPWEITGR